MNPERIDELLTRATRLAARGHGGAEPNPMVGCVIANGQGEVVGEGFHRRCGGPHAEIEALRAAGNAARGATALVTLEPCAHRGRTGPCTDALLEAGVATVIYAVRDPNPIAEGGARRLASAGVEVLHVPHAAAHELSLPFVKRVTTGLPWISAKWAQSLDGAIALRNGDSKWISCERSRRMVHRERGRVDAVLTGIGTVLADNPRLTARGVRIMRPAVRVVYDPDACTPPDAHVCDGTAPTTLLVRAALDAAAQARAERLAARGVRLLSLGPADTLAAPLRALSGEGIARVLVESGGGLLGRLVRENLLDEAWVFVAPIVIGDREAPRSVRGLSPKLLSAIPGARMLSVRRRGADALLNLRWWGAPEA